MTELVVREMPESETWSRIQGVSRDFGVTRVADITGLDWIGVPVATAFRPNAATLSVSQGKGNSVEAAKVGAVMESLELAHAERVPKTGDRLAAARELRLGYAVDTLNLAPGSFLSERVAIPWTRSFAMQTGCEQWLPTDLVRVSFAMPERVEDASVPLFWGSSNGLAAGSTTSEAAIHALLEVIERDALTRSGADSKPLALTDIAGCGSATVDLVAGNAEVITEIEALPNRFGLPCFRARMWSEDFPLVAVGSGAALSRVVAAERAVNEAAQTRLTQIAGVRDDIDERRFVSAPQSAVPQRRDIEYSLEPEWVELPGGGSADFTLEWLVSHVVATTGQEPLLARLSSSADFSVVRVVLPTAQFDLSHSFSGLNAMPAAAER